MKNIKYITLSSLCSLLFLLSGCRDEFSDLNTNPSNIVKANPVYLYSQGVIDFEPSGYTFWFYNAPMLYKYGQMGVPTGGFSDRFFEQTVNGEQGGQNRRVLKYSRDIDDALSKLPTDEAKIYQNISSALDVLTIYLGIFDTDMFGDMPFSEACRARYGGTFTPKYDKIEELYTTWLDSLTNATETFLNSKNQNFPEVQDPIYGGNPAKWAKLSNSLKLKIAVRLYNNKPAEALKIAEEVANSPAGVLDGEEDDFLFNKASSITNNDAEKVYHWNNDFLTTVAANKHVMDFMLKNKDPRVRFFYRKNRWNSKIVQAFFDAGKDSQVPAYIIANVDYNEVNGKKQFVGWKGLGEPWVRYYGLPTEMNAGTNNAKYGDYFDYANRSKLDDKHIYRPFSTFQKEMIIGAIDFTLPTAPDDKVIEDKEDRPWYGMYMTTSEVNLYLAEFKLLGANLPKTAAEYFTTAVRASVTEYDRLAGLNKIPYYGTTYDYDPFEKEIDLQDGELDDMMNHPDYQLTGDVDSDLEKVFLQQLLHFTLSPSDQFITVRRSGYPKVGSSLIPWDDFKGVVTSDQIPRRYNITSPASTEIMKDIILASAKDQGFDLGIPQEGKLLNSQRVWQDKAAPQFGEGFVRK